ncbi:MAG: peptide ABC transporter substrate-binding protein [Spirochaetales bacterium]|nr:peptide ABC transporter substrate-binding protein [Spirochaetales bacterium]MCF7937366.1 peptide ABC transporter substrate-binding protein [Spirochaetales bacterium]
MKIQRVPAFLLSLFLFVSVFAWSETEETVEKSEFVVSFGNTEINLNPIQSYKSTEAQIYTALYEGLVSYNPYSLEPEPAVATYWETEDNNTLYRFYLRDSAVYWNGDRVTAQHFRDTWLKMIDPETGAAYSSLFDVISGAREYRTGKTEDPDSVGIRAVSDSVLEVRLTHPAPHFLRVLCHHSFAPVHPSFLQKDDWSEFNTAPANGPYYLLEESEDEMILKKNDLYWDRKNVEVQQIRIIFSDDSEEITRQYNMDKIDWVADSIHVPKVENRDALLLYPMFATHYYYIRSAEPPFDDPGVRRGLALLLPWQEIRRDYPLPATTLIPAIPSYPENEGFAMQDTEEGMKALEEAGYPEGKGIGSITIRIPDGTEGRRIAGLMKEAWESRLEVEVKKDLIPFPRYYDSLKKTDYTIGSLTWIGDFLDPLTFLQMWTSESNLNDAGYSNPEYDELIDRAMTQYGVSRYQTLAEAEQLLLDTAGVLPVSHSPSLNLIDTDIVAGWFPNLLDIHPFKYIHFEPYPMPPGVVRGPAEKTPEPVQARSSGPPPADKRIKTSSSSKPGFFDQIMLF